MALIVFLSVMTARAQTEEKIHLVEVTELTQETTFQIMTVEAFQLSQADMTLKNQLLPKAIDVAIKEWAREHPNSGPFPKSAVGKGQIKSLGVFTDKAKAEQELKERQTREEEQASKKLSGIERQLAQLRDQLQKLKALNNPTDDQQKQINSLQGNIKMLEEQVARKKKREDEKNAHQILARELFQTVLTDLLAEAKKK